MQIEKQFGCKTYVDVLSRYFICIVTTTMQLNNAYLTGLAKISRAIQYPFKAHNDVTQIPDLTNTNFLTLLQVAVVLVDLVRLPRKVTFDWLNGTQLQSELAGNHPWSRVSVSSHFPESSGCQADKKFSTMYSWLLVPQKTKQHVIPILLSSLGISTHRLSQKP